MIIEKKVSPQEENVINNLIMLINNDKDDLWDSFRQEYNFDNEHPAHSIIIDMSIFRRTRIKHWEQAIINAQKIDDVINHINNHKVYWGLNPLYLGMKPYNGSPHDIPSDYIIIKTFT